MKENANILKISYAMYFMLLVVGIAIIANVLKIQIKEGESLRKLGTEHTIQEVKTEALRGNIFSHNGELLAVTTPKYEIRFDPISNKTDDFFRENIDSLAYLLSHLFNDKSTAKYKNEISQARRTGNRYYLVAKNVTYDQFEEMKTFPIFRMGRNKGGVIVIQTNKRDLPYNLLAKRSIGIYNYESGMYKVGIEGAYDQYLKGTEGKRLMQKISGGLWMPIDPVNELEPKNGHDVYTTIDIEIQDIAEHSLEFHLRKNKAKHGSVVVMEVKTGAVLAIANLGIDKKGNYSEDYNYAIGESSEPGSTFKLASALVALEDGVVRMSDLVDTEGGQVTYFNKTIRDSHKIKDGILSLQEIIEESSNVGIAKIIQNGYRNNPQKFIDGLYKIGLNKVLEIPLDGEGLPYIKSTSDKTWSGISLPWIAHGYEIQLTPLQILSFYNAIANDGKMLRPMFVKEIRNMNMATQTFSPEVINEQIASKETIEKLQQMLQGVVDNGTAKNIKNEAYSIAGKTGTAQIAQKNLGYNKSNYKASFVGYFPASNPRYSCIVVINDPSEDSYYGSAVAAPVFKEIADRLFASNLDIEEEISTKKEFFSPLAHAGFTRDYHSIYSKIGIPVALFLDTEWVECKPDTLLFEKRALESDSMPNLLGMTAKDALYILEELGISFKMEGKGFVVEQSIVPGTPIDANILISIILATL